MNKPTNPPLFTSGNCQHCGSRWHLSESCVIQKPPTFPPVRVTPDGEALGPYPGSDIEDTKIIGLCFATHFVCNGFVDLIPVSLTHNALVCRSCKLRIVIPNTVETWGDLRKNFDDLLPKPSPTRRAEESAKAPEAVERRHATCGVCNWTNVGCLNLATVGDEAVWMCHGCIARERKTLVAELADAKESIASRWTEIHALQDHARALAAELERAKEFRRGVKRIVIGTVRINRETGEIVADEDFSTEPERTSEETKTTTEKTSQTHQGDALVSEAAGEIYPSSGGRTGQNNVLLNGQSDPAPLAAFAPSLVIFRQRITSLESQLAAVTVERDEFANAALAAGVRAEAAEKERDKLREELACAQTRHEAYQQEYLRLKEGRA